MTGPLPEGIARDAEEAARGDERRNAFHRANGWAPYPGARRISLLCRACRRTGEYECDPPTMAELASALSSKKGLRVPARFPCKFCGTRGELEASIVWAISLEGGAMAHERARKGRR